MKKRLVSQEFCHLSTRVVSTSISINLCGITYWVTAGLFKSCPWEVAYCCFNFTKRTRQTRTMFVCIPSDTIEQMFLHFPGRLLMPKGTDRIPRSWCWNTILQSFCFSERRLSKRTSCITLQSEKITGTNQDCLCLLQPFCCLCNLQVFLKVQKWNETYDCLFNIDKKSMRNPCPSLLSFLHLMTSSQLISCNLSWRLSSIFCLWHFGLRQTPCQGHGFQLSISLVVFCHPTEKSAKVKLDHLQ